MIAEILCRDKDVKMSKRLSVIIPGYNTSENWWRRCVISVRAACGSEDEIICVDDGSIVPVRAEWVFADTDARITLVRTENQGLPAARNIGLQYANGIYVAFVDSDDEVAEEIFEACLCGLEKTGFDICVYGVRTIWVEERMTKTDVLPEMKFMELRPSDILCLYKNCLFNYAWNKVYRRAFLREHDLWFDIKGVPCEDVIFNLQCVMACAKWMNLGIVGYTYYRTGGTLLSNYKATNVIGWRKASDTWVAYKEATPGACEVLGTLEEQTEASLARSQWLNIWRKNSPFNLWQRWEYLRNNSSIFGGWPVFVFCRQAIFTLIRRHFYFRFVRRWNIRRICPTAVDWEV